MIRLEAKKISIDDVTKEPVLILEDEKSKKSMDILINTLELPWFISFFYNIPQENNTIFHFINSLSNSFFFKLKKIILFKEKRHFSGRLVFSFFFLKKVQTLNVSDAMLLAVATGTPIFIEESNLERKNLANISPEALFLHNWDPDKNDASLN